MAMSKKDFIALADAIRAYNESAFPAGTNTASPIKFGHTQLLVLADFCKRQNANFMRERWLDYIAGKCGQNGGAIKTVSFDVQGNYGQGFETVTSEDTRKEAMARLREYRENEPQFTHRIKRVTGGV